MAGEARTMEYLRGHGYPVPAVDEVGDDGTDLVMERIDGTSMVDFMSRRPWAIRRQGALLATLHRRLHAIAPPDFLPPAPVGSGDCFLHMDLHPLNVMIGVKGPVVIDWPNAARGDARVDVVLAWVLMAAGEIPLESPDRRRARLGEVGAGERLPGQRRTGHRPGEAQAPRGRGVQGPGPQHERARTACDVAGGREVRDADLAGSRHGRRTPDAASAFAPMGPW